MFDGFKIPTEAFYRERGHSGDAFDSKSSREVFDSHVVRVGYPDDFPLPFQINFDIIV